MMIWAQTRFSKSLCTHVYTPHKMWSNYIQFSLLPILLLFLKCFPFFRGGSFSVKNFFPFFLFFSSLTQKWWQNFWRLCSVQVNKYMRRVYVVCRPRDQSSICCSSHRLVCRMASTKHTRASLNSKRNAVIKSRIMLAHTYSGCCCYCTYKAQHTRFQTNDFISFSDFF